MSSSDDLDVSVDAISPGLTPGQKLRRAREERGLSLDDVTTETNLAGKYLQALESDDYAALPGLAFARGYARRYAQLVQIEGSTLIAEMDQLAASQGIVVAGSFSSAAQKSTSAMSEVAARKSSDQPSGLTQAVSGLRQLNLANVLSVGSVVLLILLLLGTLFWQSNDDASTEPLADNSVIDMDADLEPQLPPEAAVPVAPVPEVPVEPVAVEALPAAEGTTELAPAIDGVPATAAAPVAATGLTPAVAPAGQALPPAPGATATLLPKPATTMPVAPAPTAAVAKPPGIDSLNFSFSGKSWISVRDATGQELVYGLKNSGQAVTVTGQAPFSINIGNVNVTALSRNGRAVNLKQYARGEIASFRLAPVAAPAPAPAAMPRP